MLVSLTFHSSCPSSHRSECTPFTCLIITGTGGKNHWNSGIQTLVDYQEKLMRKGDPLCESNPLFEGEKRGKVDLQASVVWWKKKGGREKQVYGKNWIVSQETLLRLWYHVIREEKGKERSVQLDSQSRGFRRWHFDPKAVKLNFLPTGRGERGPSFVTFTETHCRINPHSR